jgi:hypothetical protein
LTTTITTATIDYCTSSTIADTLFLEMCDLGPLVDHTCDSNDACKYGVQMNKYYLRALEYARRISLGDFSGENAKYEPEFVIDFEDFSPELRSQLLIAKESLDIIVTEAVFRLFKARHKMVFYDHIQPHKLRWRISGVP